MGFWELFLLELLEMIVISILSMVATRAIKKNFGVSELLEAFNNLGQKRCDFILATYRKLEPEPQSKS